LVVRGGTEENQLTAGGLRSRGGGKEVGNGATMRAGGPDRKGALGHGGSDGDFLWMASSKRLKKEVRPGIACAGKKSETSQKKVVLRKRAEGGELETRRERALGGTVLAGNRFKKRLSGTSLKRKEEWSRKKSRCYLNAGQPGGGKFQLSLA